MNYLQLKNYIINRSFLSKFNFSYSFSPFRVELMRNSHLKYLQKGFLQGFPSQLTSVSMPVVLGSSTGRFILSICSVAWANSWWMRMCWIVRLKLWKLFRCQERVDSAEVITNWLDTWHTWPHIRVTLIHRDSRRPSRLFHHRYLRSAVILETPQKCWWIVQDARYWRGSGCQGSYCAVVAGKLIGCWDEELEDGLVTWISNCQTWEGGFGGVPVQKPTADTLLCHCSFILLISPDDLKSVINVDSLIYWLTSQQVQQIGGFRVVPQISWWMLFILAGGSVWIVSGWGIWSILLFAAVRPGCMSRATRRSERQAWQKKEKMIKIPHVL